MKSTAARTPTAPLHFEHIGFITHESKPNESFVPATRVWRTDFTVHPYRIEWLRFEPDSPVPAPVRELPHVAFRVDDIRAAARGLKVLLEPFDVGPRIVGFYQTDDGAVIEFLQYKNTSEQQSFT
jgi:hypothetical protein